MSYAALEARQQEIAHLEHAASMLSWDEAVMMPTGGGDARADAMATLAKVRHRLMTSRDTPLLLDAARAELIDAWQAANVREIERDYQRSQALPERLVAELGRATVMCEQAWRKARARNDWQAVAAQLATVTALCREKAERLADLQGVTPYDALLATYQSGTSEAAITSLFAELRRALPPLIERRLACQRDDVVAPAGPFPVATQRRLSAVLMEKIGFDFARGRLDSSHHPFCGGVPDDTRITTRYDEADFLKGLMGTLHETGHALYEQGCRLPIATSP
ncbi:MAG: carboxypeptidase M32 [Gammaproteobacteria bacterium]|nr:carboxypeptidase M32 [Gammaproteobacteria bacterium]